MALTKRQPATPTKGVAKPRLAPPVPVRSMLAEYEAAAKDMGIKLMPWQQIAARYLTAVKGERFVYRSFACVVARQNGKTELLIPYILMNLRMGRRILHTAQNRILPREVFLRIAALLDGKPEVDEIRYANGQEVIKFTNGGRYTLVAPRPGVRGNSVDIVILDEVREQSSFELMAGIKPTMTASRNPQIVYLSNAGDESSVVLNDLRRRMDTDLSMAYLEWSASPERALDDRQGWAEANPALGITIQPETLEDFYASLPPAVFETEHLCRWVISMQPRLIADDKWERAHQPIEKPRRPMLGISMDNDGIRASAALAWQQTDGTIALRIVADVTGSPIDTTLLGKDFLALRVKAGAMGVGFDPWTDAELAKHLKGARAINGREFANACQNFVQLVESGRLRWEGAEQVSEDLMWTARKVLESTAWIAVKAKEDRPVTALLAAIRAVGLASGPQPTEAKVF